MPSKTKTAALGSDTRHGGFDKLNHPIKTFNHTSTAAASVFVPVYDGGRFVSLRRFENRAAARAAMRQGVLG